MFVRDLIRVCGKRHDCVGEQEEYDRMKNEPECGGTPRHGDASDERVHERVGYRVSHQKEEEGGVQRELDLETRG